MGAFSFSVGGQVFSQSLSPLLDGSQLGGPLLGARLRGHAATQHAKKGSEKGACYGLYSKKDSEKG